MGATPWIGSEPTSPVEVRNRFDGRWSGGYDVAEVDLTGGKPRYRVRRHSDGGLLPTWFHPEELREPESDFAVDWQLAP